MQQVANKDKKPLKKFWKIQKMARIFGNYRQNFCVAKARFLNSHRLLNAFPGPPGNLNIGE